MENKGATALTIEVAAETSRHPVGSEVTGTEATVKSAAALPHYTSFVSKPVDSLATVTDMQSVPSKRVVLAPLSLPVATARQFDNLDALPTAGTIVTFDMGREASPSIVGPSRDHADSAGGTTTGMTGAQPQLHAKEKERLPVIPQRGPDNSLQTRLLLLTVAALLFIATGTILLVLAFIIPCPTRGDCSEQIVKYISGALGVWFPASLCLCTLAYCRGSISRTPVTNINIAAPGAFQAWTPRGTLSGNTTGAGTPPAAAGGGNVPGNRATISK